MTALPFLKWAGGKRSLVPTIRRYLPASLKDRRYFEPFLGGGAVGLSLAGEGLAARFLTDVNVPLIDTFRAVRDTLPGLREALRRLSAERDAWSRGEEDHYYQVRDRFNASPSPVGLIYLNHCGFNGLYRVAKDGTFNVPFGRHKSPPKLYDAERFEAASKALRGATLGSTPFEYALCAALRDDVYYLDPPYVPRSETSKFVGYASGGFDHAELSKRFREADERGAWLVMSNSDTPTTRALYQGFALVEVKAKRSIAAAAGSRAPVGELLILSRTAAEGISS